MDFIVGNTFPQLAVNYGSSDNFEDDSCIKVNLNGMSDFILNETMDLFKVIEYKYNQNKCKTKEEMLAQRAEVEDFFSSSPDSVKKLKELEDAFRERMIQMDKIGDEKSKERKAAGQNTKGSKPTETPSPQEIKDNPQKSAGDFIQALNPCDFAGNLSAVLKCIASALTLDEMYYTLIKQIISSVGEQALEIIMQTLPANKQAEIRKEVEKQFKDMPFPWDDSWEGGSLGKAVDRQTAKNIQENKDKSKNIGNQLSAEYSSLSIGKKIEEIEKRLSELNDPNLYSNYLEGLSQDFDKLQVDKEKVIEEISQVLQEEAEIIYSIREDKKRLQSLEDSFEQLMNIAGDTLFDENVNLDQLAREESQRISSLSSKIKNQELYLEVQNSARNDQLNEELDRIRAQILDQAGKIVESDEDFDAVIEPEKRALNEELEVLKKKKIRR